MSTIRKWVAKWDSGYVGTGGEEVIDLIDDWGWDEEQLADTSDEDIAAELGDWAYTQATESCEGYAEPASGGVQ